jgi:hypothetical protein
MPEFFEPAPVVKRYRLLEEIRSTVKSTVVYGAKHSIVTIVRWAEDVSIVERLDGERFAVRTAKLGLL